MPKSIYRLMFLSLTVGVWLLSFSPTYALTVCPDGKGDGDGDDQTVTIAGPTSFEATDQNKGLIDCGSKKLVVDSTLTILSNIKTADSSPVDDYGITIKAAAVTVTAKGIVTADGRGYGPNVGPGRGFADAANGGGGGYGGNGKHLGGAMYGSSLKPIYLGSGGGTAGNGKGGFGGGAIRIQSPAVTINGLLSAKGISGSGGWCSRANGGFPCRGGGGSGGSILIETDDFFGSGEVNSNGGDYGGGGSGGGGGGRVAIYTKNFNFSGVDKILAKAGNGGSSGENGTAGVFVQQTSGQYGLIIANDFAFTRVDLEGSQFISGLTEQNTINLAFLKMDNGKFRIEPGGEMKVFKVSGEVTMSNATIEQGVSSSFEVGGNFSLTGSSLWQAAGTNIRLSLVVGENITVEALARINFDGSGYGEKEGTGFGVASGTSRNATGGSHGGAGGDTPDVFGKNPYGSSFRPATFGSAGGRWGNAEGGNGGGSISLISKKDILFDGLITAFGLPGGVAWCSVSGRNGYCYGGGGAGGSIYLSGDKVAGKGKFLVNGGAAGGGASGGGGGGRIAIYGQTVTFDFALNSTALAGSGGKAEAGTVGFFEKEGERYGLNVYTTFIFEPEDLTAGLESLGVREDGYYLASLSSEIGSIIRVRAGTVEPVLDVSGDVILKNARLDQSVSMKVLIGGNFSLLEQSVWQGQGRKVGLDLNVGGTTTIGGVDQDLSKLSFDGTGFVFGDMSDLGQGRANGYVSTQASGGGYGGAGQSTGSISGGKVHGSSLLPDLFGSAGGTIATAVGGKGGGKINLHTDNLILHGIISVNGEAGKKARCWFNNRYNDCFSGGGSGGGVLLISRQGLHGSGQMEANGGNGAQNLAGGGGGGRIAIYSESAVTDLTAFENFTARMGVGGYGGGNGSVGLFTRTAADQPYSLLVRSDFALVHSGAGLFGPVTADNQFQFQNITVDGARLIIDKGDGADKNITILGNLSLVNGAVLDQQISANWVIGGNLDILQSSIFKTMGTKILLNLNVLGKARIGLDASDANARLIADSGGQSSSAGAGAGRSSSNPVSSGGGYGGAGRNAGTANGGTANGSSTKPDDFGSGGGLALGTVAGGAGGGKIHLTVKGNLDLHGLISANGASGSKGTCSYNNRYTTCLSGGGSGGSVWLETDGLLSGSGFVQVNGGAGAGSGQPGDGGGGGGGRAAIYYANSSLETPEQSIALAGVGGTGGVDGSVCFFKKGVVQSLVVFTNCRLEDQDFSAGRLTLSDVLVKGTLKILSGADKKINVTKNLQLIGGTVLHSASTAWSIGGTLDLQSGSKLLTQGGQKVLNLDVGGSAILAAGSLIDVTGGGFDSGQGIGAGKPGAGLGSGGGYGGEGAGVNGAAGGITYGDEVNPQDLGSGGGAVASAVGGTGGGVITLTVKNNLTIDGDIQTNGMVGAMALCGRSDCRGGSGSGGSILIKTYKTLAGSGSLKANGADGRDLLAGGGGGGRIAYFFGTNQFKGTMTVDGGRGGNRVGAGSIKEGLQTPLKDFGKKIESSLPITDRGRESNSNDSYLGELITDVTNALGDLDKTDFDNSRDTIPADQRAVINIYPDADVGCVETEDWKCYSYKVRGYADNLKYGKIQFDKSPTDPVRIRLVEDKDPSRLSRFKGYLVGLAWNDQIGWIQFDWKCTGVFPCLDNDGDGIFDRRVQVKKYGPFDWRFSGFAWNDPDQLLNTVGEGGYMSMGGAKTEWDSDYPIGDFRISYIEPTSYSQTKNMAVAGYPNSGYEFRYNLLGGLSKRPLIEEFGQRLFDKYSLDVRFQAASGKNIIYRNQIDNSGQDALNWQPVSDSLTIDYAEAFVYSDEDEAWIKKVTSEAPSGSENNLCNQPDNKSPNCKDGNDFMIESVQVKISNKISGTTYWQDSFSSKFINFEKGIVEGELHFAPPLYFRSFTMNPADAFAILAPEEQLNFELSRDLVTVGTLSANEFINNFSNKKIEAVFSLTPSGESPVNFVFDSNRDGSFNLVDQSSVTYSYSTNLADPFSFLSPSDPMTIPAALVKGILPADNYRGINPDATAFIRYQSASGQTVQYPALDFVRTPEVCDDNKDNDGDGFVDCKDTAQCGGMSVCQEVCGNGVDDNGVDGIDEGCSGGSGPKEVCDSPGDEDGDLAVDCDDADCKGVGVCNGGGEGTKCGNFNGQIICTCDDLSGASLCTQSQPDVKGIVSLETGIGSSYQDKFVSIGDLATKGLRDSLLKNIAKWLSGVTIRNRSDCLADQGMEATITLNPAGTDFVYTCESAEVMDPQDASKLKFLYFKNIDLVIGSKLVNTLEKRQNITQFLSDRTIVVEGGNIFVMGDLYDVNNHGLGLVALSSRVNNQIVGGNVYIGDQSTYLQASLYADGSIFRFNEAIKRTDGTLRSGPTDQTKQRGVVGTEDLKVCEQDSLKEEGTEVNDASILDRDRTEIVNQTLVCVPKDQTTICPTNTEEDGDGDGIKRKYEPCFSGTESNPFSVFSILGNQFCFVGTLSSGGAGGGNTLGSSLDGKFPTGRVSKNNDENFRAKLYDLSQFSMFASTLALETCPTDPNLVVQQETGDCISQGAAVLSLYPEGDLMIPSGNRFCSLWTQEGLDITNQKTMLEAGYNKAVYLRYKSAPKNLPGFEAVGQEGAQSF